MKKGLSAFALACLALGRIAAQPVLVAPACGAGTAYDLLKAAGYSLELPDCKHAVPHIVVQPDAGLTGCVFAFTDHRDLDDDRCMNSDRQRTEIRRIDKAIVNGTSWSHSWKFKLDAGFKPSQNFTHIHQIKALGGDADAPMWTLDALSEGTEKLKVMYVGPTNNGSFPASVPLAPFKGNWVQAVEHITYGTAGKYSIVLTRISDGQVLLSYSTNSINNWRSGADSYGPKWGVYRSLLDKSPLRDETVLFADICRANGDTGCPGGEREGGIDPVIPRAPAVGDRGYRGGYLEFGSGPVGYRFEWPGRRNGSEVFGLNGKWLHPLRRLKN